MKATWNGETLAEGNTVVVEGNHYFRPEDVNMALMQPSATHTHCGWKGEASYYNIAAGGKINEDAAWFYPETLPEANHVKGRVAFWKGVQISA